MAAIGEDRFVADVSDLIEERLGAWQIATVGEGECCLHEGRAVEGVEAKSRVGIDIASAALTER